MAQAMAVTPVSTASLATCARGAVVEGGAGRRARQRHAATDPAAVPQRVGALDLVDVDGVVAVQHDEVGGLAGRVAQAHEVRSRRDAQPVDPADARGEADELQAERVRPVRVGVQEIALDQVREDAGDGHPGHAGAGRDLLHGEAARGGRERAQHGEAVGEERRLGAELERRRAERPGALVGAVRDEAPLLEQVEQAVGAGAGDVARRGDDARRRRARCGGRGTRARPARGPPPRSCLLPLACAPWASRSPP